MGDAIEDNEAAATAKQVIEDLEALAEKAENDLDEMIALGSTKEEKRKLRLVKEAAEEKLMAAVDDAMKADIPALKALTTALQKDLESIEKHSKGLLQAVKAVELFAELVKLAAAAAKKMAMA